MKRTNEDLEKIYDKVYELGENIFFSIPSKEITEEISNLIDWQDKEVLEVGCGTGELSHEIAKKGGKTYAIDYSEKAISLAKEKFKHENLIFEKKKFEDAEGKYDVVVAEEILEHIDDPLKALEKLKSLIKDNGMIIVSCPNFLNIRGYIWMTLAILFDVPMSLTDIHYICQFDIEQWAKELNLKLEWKTIMHNYGNGEKMLVDMDKRLKNALKDAKMDISKVDKLIDWLRKAINYDNNLRHTGVTGIYILKKLN